MKKILIADDTYFMRHHLTKILTKENYEVVAEAANGEECVELYKTMGADVVILDITMPVKDGIEALKEIMQYDPNAKVIMCSALGFKEKILEAITAGAKDFVVKPFKEERVIEALKRLEEL